MNEAGINPDVISYNSLISFAARKCLSKSLNLFDEMLQRGIYPDIWSYNILMNFLFKLGKLEEANRIFMDIVLGEFRPSPAMYNVIINGLCKNEY
ncbi:putative pentatricopeptide [Lupinus albus]|uniref:Putative pentatricopeptide n=1 Tax=Lupinus albus TaxID=3870 RepID=A0A6A4P1K9_LUPAL|nr:putative pentatricopeptide [Lupinus albus]